MNNASLKTTKLWQDINWAKVQRKVFKLQKQIFQAVKSGNKAKARKLQKLLFKSYYAKLLAVRRVTQENQGKKTAGVDGKKVIYDYQRQKLVNELEAKGYKAKALRRVWIPKPGRDEKRPLGIPTILDRAMQALVKSAIEPYWEAQFEGSSYGFRPGRATHDAIDAIFNQIRYKPKFVLDADIAQCFDKINHDYLISKIDCPSMFKPLIKQWLKAGVMDNGIFQETNNGTPQGGVISPLLANIALDGMIKDIVNAFPKSICRKGKQIHGYQPKIIRYADDFVCFHSELEVIKQCKTLISKWLNKAGLELKPEKTRICHTLKVTEIDGQSVKPGFDFLGFNIRQYPVGKYHSGKNTKGSLLGFKTIIKPSSKSIKAHYENMRSIINKLKHAPQIKLIQELNPVIRGWCNYHSTVCSQETFSKMDHLLWCKLRAWIRRRTGKASLKKFSKYFSPGKHGAWTFQTHQVDGFVLHNHSKTEIKRHILVRPNASPYDGNWTYWSKRKGEYPETPKRVSKLIKKQKGKCTLCNQSFTPDDIVEIDHITPRSKGGKDESKNLQLLHRHCHDTKTRYDGSLDMNSNDYQWVDDVLTVPMTKAD